MASEATIANLAYSHIGKDANISTLDDASVEARRAKSLYPQARNTLLEMHSWRFATRREVLALVATPTAVGDAWLYCYAAPSDMLRLLSVLPEGYTLDIDNAAEFDVETASDGSALILTNTENAIGRYTLQVTDTARFSPLFVDCLAWLLASYLAGIVIKGDAGEAAARTAYATFLTQFGRATSSSANQSKLRFDPTPTGIAARA